MKAAHLHQGLLSRIGGPHSTGWPVIVAGSAFIWLLFASMVLPPQPTEQAVRVVFVAIAQLPLTVILRGSHYTVLRHATERPRPWLTVAVFAVASGSFVAIFGSLIKDRPVDPPAQSTFGYVETAVIIVIVLVTAAVAADALAQNRSQQDELSRERERLQHLRAVVAIAIAERHRRIVEQVEAQLTSAIAQLSATSPREAVDTLRWAAQELVRPLSHDLATRSVPFEPTFPVKSSGGLSWASVCLAATAGTPVRVLGVPLVSFAATLLYRVDRNGWVLGTLGDAVNSMAMLLGAVVANRILSSLSPRLPAWGRASAFTLSLAAMGVMGAFAQRLLLNSQGTVGSLLVNVMLTVFIGWALALLAAAGRQLEANDTEVRALRREVDWEVARANQTQWQQQRSLARALHGPLQSAVNAAALRVDAALRHGGVTPELIAHERTSILEALGQLETASSDRIPDLELDCRRLRGTWQDLCDIEIDMADGVLANIAADPACSSAVSDSLTESCANAIKHAGATHIKVDIDQPDGERLVTIVIDNDGQPMDPTARRGLGTSLIEDVACEWHVEALPGWTRISVTLPTAIGATRTRL